MPRLPGVSDVLHLLEAQTQALLTLPEAVVQLTSLARDAHAVVRRVDRMLDDLEAPLRALAPGLTRLAETLRGDELATLLAEINDTHRQVAAIASTTGRLMGVIDDVSARVSALPGADLLARRRAKSPTP